MIEQGISNFGGEVFGGCRQTARKTSKTSGTRIPISQRPMHPVLTASRRSCMSRHSLLDVLLFRQREVVTLRGRNGLVWNNLRRTPDFFLQNYQFC
jgi:hypothetical protein